MRHVPLGPSHWPANAGSIELLACRRRTALSSTKASCPHCGAQVKEKFLPGHEAGCVRNPRRDTNLPARERKA